MIMVDWEILEAIETGALEISPFDASLINPASIDFRLGTRFCTVVPSDRDNYLIKPMNIKGMLNCGFSSVRRNIINPVDPSSFKTVHYKPKYKLEEIPENNRGKFVLDPGQFLITCTKETFNFKGSDYGIAAKVMGKSSLGRLGLANSSMAGYIDPGFNAPITLEIHNYHKFPILLTPGMKIGQLVLFRTKVPKLDYSVTGRYQNQSFAEGSKGVTL